MRERYVPRKVVAKSDAGRLLYLIVVNFDTKFMDGTTVLESNLVKQPVVNISDDNGLLRG